MDDLVKPERAKQSATLAGLSATNPAYLASLISAASTAIRRHCKRDFTVNSYCEYCSGGYYNETPLILNNTPVLSITRIAADPELALLVQNSSNANQRATVATTPTGLTLYRVASGIPSTDTVAYSANLTLAAMATAIGSIGNGWSATVQGNYGLWPSVDLKPLQGAASATGGGAYLEMYTEDLQSVGTCDGYGWRLDPDMSAIYAVFPRGNLNIRVDYTAGFASVPADVQQATVITTQSFYEQSSANSALKSAKLGNADVVFANKLGIPVEAKQLLAPYVDHARMISR